MNANNLNEFIKTDLLINLYKSLFNEFFTTKFQAQLGGIYSFNNNNNDSNNNNKLTPIHPSDKFYLGGYNSFLDFQKIVLNYKVVINIINYKPHYIQKFHPFYMLLLHHQQALLDLAMNKI